MNITKVGESLSRELTERGIQTDVDTTNMTASLHSRDMQWHQAYLLSREIVKTSIEENKEINYIFDLHRDSTRRDVTIVTINNEVYARILFVIGESHPDYEKNLKLAKELHYKLEEKYPGLSRGVFGKDLTDGNGIYNQDLMENSILIEFGGVDNHMDELYRSTEAFAEVFHSFLEEMGGNHE
jgi:stage II sporulation protein P